MSKPGNEPDTALVDSSPSVQAHLSILQAVIQRMAGNSAGCKTWCITIVSAILVVTAEQQNPSVVWIAVFPTALFAALDIYYLALEKGFRCTYEAFVRKLHTGDLLPSDLYDVQPTGSVWRLQAGALRSFSVWGFYLPVAMLALVVGWAVSSGVA
ncbi:MAG: hypothetical protein D9V44_03140 [Actinobacteria bacterium]|nr:MAG: hypothetical protein D9V44_03140 [Actinomycetota bacterium]